MDYRKSAQEVLDNVGGADNVVSAAHCATRLRLVIADNAKVDKEAIENIDGAKGVFEAQGQLQIIFGTGTVNKVYEEFIALSGVEAATKAEVKEAAAQQQNIFMRAIKVLGDVFVPISMEKFKDNHRKAFYGKCLVVLQNNGEPGGVKVTATADGLEKATTAIKVK